MFKPVIKWSGSKRSQSETIKSYLPDSFNTYYEPFIGGGSMLYAIHPKRAICGDICAPLINLWNEIKNNPEKLAEEYRLRWLRLQEEGYSIYYKIREHHTRPGISPDSLKTIILDWSDRIQCVEFMAQEYFETTANVQKGDLVYLDPPYFHTKGRYYGNINFEKFISYLESLNRRDIKYMLSFDGIRGKNDFTVDLPKELYKRHIFIPSGNSSFKKVMDKKDIEVVESLYLNW